MTWKRMRWLRAAPVLVLVLMAGACSQPKFRYVAHSSTDTYLKVPREWKAYDGPLLDQVEARAVEAAGEAGPSFVDQAFQGDIQWRVAFDGDPHPEALHAVSYADAPVAEVRVRQLTESERDQVNLASLRNIFFPYDQLKAELDQERKEQPLQADPPASSSFRPLGEKDLQQKGGLRGSRIRFELRQADQFYVIDQTALLDPKSSRVYVLLIRAGEAQFITHIKLLDEIATSFTIKPKS